MFQCTSNYWSVLLHEFLCVVGTMFMNFNISLEERILLYRRQWRKGNSPMRFTILDEVLKNWILYCQVSNDVFCWSFAKRTILFLLCMYLSIFKILNQPAWSQDIVVVVVVVVLLSFLWIRHCFQQWIRQMTTKRQIEYNNE